MCGTIPHYSGSEMVKERTEESTEVRKGARTVIEFAAWAGLNRTRVFEEIKAGRLEARKCGRATLITHEAGEEFLRSLPVRPVPKAS